MKVLNLTSGSQIYTSNAYLITGDWNKMDDVNTLIDTGRDPEIFESIDKAPTGFGKKKVSQIILTHSHYDHAELLCEAKNLYNSKVYAFSRDVTCVDEFLKNGDFIKIADRIFEVIHTPGHSNDSICLYNSEEKVLFAGDTPLIIRSKDNTYEQNFIEALKYLSTKKVGTIYFGHGPPLNHDCMEMISNTIKNISIKM